MIDDVINHDHQNFFKLKQDKVPCRKERQKLSKVCERSVLIRREAEKIQRFVVRIKGETASDSAFLIITFKRKHKDEDLITTYVARFGFLFRFFCFTENQC